MKTGDFPNNLKNGEVPADPSEAAKSSAVRGSTATKLNRGSFRGADRFPRRQTGAPSPFRGSARKTKSRGGLKGTEMRDNIIGELPGGVMVAPGILVPLVKVRILAG